VSTFGEALLAARARLGAAGVANAGLDARILLGAAAGLEQAGLIARASDLLPALAEARFDAHLSRRITGEPVARILGEQEFWGLPFRLNEATLVPRADTETLVETVLAEARRRRGPLRILDVGTGSGAILIALLSELGEAEGVGIDVSEAALAMARRNAERLGVAERAAFYLADFAAYSGETFDIVVSNPPYVRSGDIAGLAREVRDHDPHLALDGGDDGLAAYRTILARLPDLLAPDGLLAFEVGHDQGVQVQSLCEAAGFRDVTVCADLAATPRVVSGYRGMSGSRRGNAKIELGKLRITG
jgi:release factor glutamine methyltransferase